MIETIGLEKARLYEQYRLPYAHEVVDDLFRQTGSPRILADIGAGTGQLTRLFAERCSKIYTVEPDAAMRHVASEVLLDYPHVTLVDAPAEQTGLDPNSIDLIVIGNAYHRFKVEAVAELLRILKPTGWVALISYSFPNNTFAEKLFPQLAELKGFESRKAKSWHQLRVEALFGSRPLSTLRYPQSAAEDWQTFWGAARSGIEAPNPSDEEFAQFKAINRSVFDAFSVDDVLRIEYETHVLYGQPKC